MDSEENTVFSAKFISQIENLKNSYLLSFATVDLLSHDEILSILEKDSFKTGSYEFCFKAISDLARNSQNDFKDLKILTWEYLMFSTRALFLQIYEAFKGDERRYAAVKKTDWFVFCANIRHSLAHGIDAIWKINSFGKDEISYTRKSDKQRIIIKESWNNQPMKFEQIGGWITPIDLIVYIENFVRSWDGTIHR